MKISLKYNFEIMDMGDFFTAVPVGERSDELHAALNLNGTGARMMELIRDCGTAEGVHRMLCRENPDDDPEKIGEQLCDFLNMLAKENLLISEAV